MCCEGVASCVSAETCSDHWLHSAHTGTQKIPLLLAQMASLNLNLANLLLASYPCRRPFLYTVELV